MAVHGRITPVLASTPRDAADVLAAVANVLASGSGIPLALVVLVDGLGLTSAAVRSGAGDIVGSAGDGVHALGGPVLEVGVPVLGGAPATLIVTGARPSQLPTLRGVASTLGLALGHTATSDLIGLAETDRDELADSLHDGPVQLLVAARFAADLAVRGSDPTIARDAVQEALVALRRQLWQLRPRGSGGLAAALDQLSSQRIAAGGTAIALLLETDLHGVAAQFAYRLVQAVSQASGPLRVAVRAQGDAVTVDVDAPVLLPSPDGWVQRAHALGGDLSTSAGRLRLLVPSQQAPVAQTPEPSSPSPQPDDARTTS